jgi:hypothetical protein
MLDAGAWKQEIVTDKDRYSWQPEVVLPDTFCLAFAEHQQRLQEGLCCHIAEGSALRALDQAQDRILDAVVSLVAYTALGGSGPDGDWTRRGGLGGNHLDPWGVA